jgi:hypothetical protein
LSINIPIYQKYYEPWEHIIIDNYYDNVLFSKMSIELVHIFNRMMENRLVLYINDISSLPATLACINSKPVDESFLSKFDKHRSYENIKVKNQIIFCNGDIDYRVHDEKPTKILSAVTYVSPVTATGTRLYNIDKSFYGDVSWAPNKMLIFCGETGVTWHSYHATGPRITINTFLETE